MNTPRKYLNSVRIFFPKFSREAVVKEVSKYVVGLREKFGLESVILFGSYAKGNYTAASDIDLLIVFNDEKSSEDEVYKGVMKAIQLPRVELHLIPKKDFKAYKGSKWIKVIEREGIKIL